MFAMELVTGAPLTERLRSGAVPVSEALALAVRDECRWPTCGCVSMDSKPYALANASPSRAQEAWGYVGVAGGRRSRSGSRNGDGPTPGPLTARCHSAIVIYIWNVIMYSSNS